MRVDPRARMLVRNGISGARPHYFDILAIPHRVFDEFYQRRVSTIFPEDIQRGTVDPLILIFPVLFLKLIYQELKLTLRNAPQPSSIAFVFERDHDGYPSIKH